MSNDELMIVNARNTDPSTSQVNRDAFAKKVSQRDAILMTYYFAASYGLTDEEVGRGTRWGDGSMFDLRVSYWKRCSELRKLSYVVPTGDTRDSSAGCAQQVCAITAEGRLYVETLLRNG